MPTRGASPAPASTYQSGHCASGFHDRCLGAYAGTTCTCYHHTADVQDSNLLADLMGGLAAHLEKTSVPVPARHCDTCTCGGAS